MSIIHIAFYPSDWLAGTRGLSAEETGIYITLICRMYEMAGPIERDDERLRRLCGCKTKARFVTALEYLISEGKITQRGDTLFNNRVQKEIKNATEKSQKAKHAAQARWEQKPNKINDRPNADVMQAHSSSTCQPEPEPYIGSGGGSACAREASDTFTQSPPPTDRERLLEAMGADPVSGLTGPNGRQIGRMSDMQEFRRWRDDLGLDLDECLGVIAEIMAAKRDGPPSTFAYFTAAMQRYAATKTAPTLVPTEGPDHEQPRDPKAQRNISSAGRAHENLVAAFAGTIPGVRS